MGAGQRPEAHHGLIHRSNLLTGRGHNGLELVHFAIGERDAHDRRFHWRQAVRQEWPWNELALPGLASHAVLANTQLLDIESPPESEVPQPLVATVVGAGNAYGQARYRDFEIDERHREVTHLEVFLHDHEGRRARGLSGPVGGLEPDLVESVQKKCRIERSEDIILDLRRSCRERGETLRSLKPEL